MTLVHNRTPRRYLRGVSHARKGCAGSGAFREPIEGDGSRPGLVVGAQRFAGERFIVLGEARGGELFEGGVPEDVSPLFLANSLQRAPDQPGDDGPDRAAPVGARVKPRLIGARARRQRPAQGPVARERRREKVLLQGVEALRTSMGGDERGEAGDGAGVQGFVHAEVVVETEVELRLPAVFEAPASARDPVLYPRAVLVGWFDEPGQGKERFVGSDQYRAEEHVLDEKGVGTLDHSLLVGGLP